MIASPVTVMMGLIPAVVVGSSVPLFGWSSDARTFNGVDAVVAGQSVDSAYFLSKHMSDLSRSKVAIFVQDSMDLSSIATSEGSLMNIKNAMETSPSSIFMPSVQDTNGLVQQLSSKAKNITPDQIGTADLADASVVVIHLGSKTLTGTDELFQDILNKLQPSFNPSTILVTAWRGTRVSSARSRRDAEASTSYEPQWACRESAGLSGCRVRRSRDTNAPKINFGSVVILTGLPVMILIVIIFVAGVFGLMVLENPDRFPDISDEHLIISTRNE